MIYVDTEQGQVDIFSTVGSNATQPLEPRSLSRKNYVICFTERSGSTMLCSILTKTGVLGKPDEYLNPRGVIQMYSGKYPSSDIFQYFDALRRHCRSDNEIFGLKTCFRDFEPLLEHRAVAKLLSPVKFIYLTRKDVVLQAISAHVARHSGIWHVRDGEAVEAECEYDKTAILDHANRLIFEQVQWERFFSFYSIEPLRITYEETLSEIESVVRRTLRFLDENENVDVSLAMAATKKIGGERNQAWAEKIRSEYIL